ncbi:MAG: MFS transporter, partial [Porticoccaceae bacterium]|nr:MFS transporter [Porticoccaceae bacterium]
VALLVWVDWQVLWVVCAGIAALGAPLLMALLREERTPQSIAESQSSFGMLNRHWTRWDALRHPLFWFMVPAILGPSAFGTAFFFHQVHYAEIKGWTHLELVTLFPVYSGAAVAAMMAYGWALDRFGTVRLITTYQLPFVVAFLFYAGCTTPLGALAGLLCMAVAVGGNVTLPNALWAEFFGTRHIGAIKASAAAAMVLGSAIGPAVTGWGIDRGVGLETQYVFVAGYYLL